MPPCNDLRWPKAAFAFIKAAEQDASLLSGIGDNPFINRMERELEDVLGLPEQRVIAISSATAGLVAALRGLGIGRGDEVIVPTYGWGQTLDPVLEVGAIPVFVDVEYGGVSLDLSQIEAARTPHTKAILTAELFGIPLDWQRLDDISRLTGLFTIADAAQSFGAIHKGPFPTAAVFSFGRGKLICGGEGGAVAAKSPEIYEAILIASQHPIRVLQNVETDLPFELVDSVAPNARIHPFAATLVTAGIKNFRKHWHQYNQVISTTRERLTAAGFPPIAVPSDASQAPPVIPVLTKQPEALFDSCRGHGWQVEKRCRKPLVLSPTVVNGQYLPALGHLGSEPQQIAVRHTRRAYPQASVCASGLFLVHPFACV